MSNESVSTDIITKQDDVPEDPDPIIEDKITDVEDESNTPSAPIVSDAHNKLMDAFKSEIDNIDDNSDDDNNADDTNDETNTPIPSVSSKHEIFTAKPATIDNEIVQYKGYFPHLAKYNNKVIVNTEDTLYGIQTRDLNDDDVVLITETKFAFGEFSGIRVPKTFAKRKANCIKLKCIDFGCRVCFVDAIMKYGDESSEDILEGYDRTYGSIPLLWNIDKRRPAQHVDNLPAFVNIIHTLHIPNFIDDKAKKNLPNKGPINELMRYRHKCYFVAHETNPAKNKIIIANDYIRMPTKVGHYFIYVEENQFKLGASDLLNSRITKPEILAERAHDNNLIKKYIREFNNGRTTARSQINELKYKYFIDFGLNPFAKIQNGPPCYDERFNLDDHLIVLLERMNALYTLAMRTFRGDIHEKTPDSAFVYAKSKRDDKIYTLEYNARKDKTRTSHGYTRPETTTLSICKKAVSTDVNVGASTSVWQNKGISSAILQNDDINEPNSSVNIDIVRGVSCQPIIANTVKTLLGDRAPVKKCAITKMVTIHLQRKYDIPLIYKGKLMDTCMTSSATSISVCSSLALHNVECGYNNILTPETGSALGNNVNVLLTHAKVDIYGMLQSILTNANTIPDSISEHATLAHNKMVDLYIPCDCIINLLDRNVSSISVCAVCSADDNIRPLFTKAYTSYEQKFREVVSVIFGRGITFGYKTIEFKNVKKIIANQCSGSECLKSLLVYIYILNSIARFDNDDCEVCLGFLYILHAALRYICLNTLPTILNADDIKKVGPSPTSNIVLIRTFGAILSIGCISLRPSIKNEMVNVDDTLKTNEKFCLENVIYNDPSVLHAKMIELVAKSIPENKNTHITIDNRNSLCLAIDSSLSHVVVGWHVAYYALSMYAELIKNNIEYMNISIAGINTHKSAFENLSIDIRVPHFPVLYPLTMQSCEFMLSKPSVTYLKNKFGGVYFPKVTFFIKNIQSNERILLGVDTMKSCASILNKALLDNKSKVVEEYKFDVSRDGSGLILKRVKMDAKEAKDYVATSENLQLTEATFFDLFTNTSVIGGKNISITTLIAALVKRDLEASLTIEKTVSFVITCKAGDRVFLHPYGNIVLSKLDDDEGARCIASRQIKRVPCSDLNSVLNSAGFDV